MAGFSWDKEAMDASISNLQSTRSSLATTSENIATAIKQKFLTIGLTGNVAETLSATCKTEVDTAVDNFLASFDSYISTCQKVNELLEEKERQDQATAGM